MADGGRKIWAQVALYLALAVTSLDLTIVNVALPTILRDLDGSNTDGQWIVDAYTLVVAGFVLLGVGLADRYGRKRLFIGGIVVFLVGSLVAALSPGVTMLIVGRAVMGLGAAALLPASLSLIAALFPPGERPTIVGRWAMAAGIALAAGPMIGGLLVSFSWWGSVFLIPMPVVGLAALIAAFAMPESKKSSEGPIDLAGAVWSVVGLGCLVAGLIEGPRMGWGSPIIVGALVAGVLGLALFVRAERKASDPMVDLGILRLRPVTGATAAIFVAQLLFFAVMLLVPQHLAFVEGLRTDVIGLLMAIPAAVFALVVIRTSTMIARWGNRTVMAWGAAIATAACVAIAAIGGAGQAGLVIAGTTVGFVGFGLMLAPASSVIMNALDDDHAGSGSAANQVARQMGAALGVAVIGSLFASVYRYGIELRAPAGLHGDDLARMTQSPANAEDVAATLNTSGADAVHAVVSTAFGWGFSASMALAAALAFAAWVTVLATIPGRPAAAPA